MSTSIFNKKIKLKINRNKNLKYYEPLKVPFIHQCYDNWCWAATGVMLLKYHNIVQNSYNQERFSVNHSNIKPELNCNCQHKKEACNKDIKYTNVEKVLANANLKMSFINNSYFRIETLKNLLINLRKPILVGFYWDNYLIDGHLIIITGIFKKPNSNNYTLFIHDPLKHKGNLEVDLDSFYQHKIYPNWRYTWKKK